MLFAYSRKHHLEVKKWSHSIMSDCLQPPWTVPGSSVHGIFQARILEWIAISFSRRLSWPRNWTWVSQIVGRRFQNTLSSPCPCLSLPSYLLILQLLMRGHHSSGEWQKQYLTLVQPFKGTLRSYKPSHLILTTAPGIQIKDKGCNLHLTEKGTKDQLKKTASKTTSNASLQCGLGLVTHF